MSEILFRCYIPINSSGSSMEYILPSLLELQASFLKKPRYMQIVGIYYRCALYGGEGQP